VTVSHFPPAKTADQDELVVTAITKRFGGLTALEDVSFTVARGETYGVIGPNGAGKTTLLGVISGAHAPDSGEVSYRGECITKMPIRDIVERGIVRTFQLASVFPDMTVLENIAVGCHLRARPSFVQEVTATRRARRAAYREERLAKDIAASVGLEGHGHERAGQLPQGLRKALSIAITLATDPEVVLLDEPVAGMNKAEIDLMLGNIMELGARGLTVIVVEHNVPFVMDICDRISVLNFGRVLAEGTPAQVRMDPAVVDAYLGTGE
jgi:branched-chain amino acid transport system ATP-binding protein